jgi:nucleoid DNA-binding protein
MDYKTLVAKTSDRAGISREKTGRVFAAFRQIVIDSLKEGEPIKFANLGTFKMVEYKATNRRDPNTHKIKAVPARQKPKFSFSRIAEDEVVV